MNNCHATRLIFGWCRARAKKTVNLPHTRTDQFTISREARVESTTITYDAALQLRELRTEHTTTVALSLEVHGGQCRDKTAQQMCDPKVHFDPLGLRKGMHAMTSNGCHDKTN